MWKSVTSPISGVTLHLIDLSFLRKLIYNIVLVSSVQPRDSVMCVCVCDSFSDSFPL